MVSYYIEPEKCKACLICLKECPNEAIDGAKKTIHVIDQEKCDSCGICFDVCPSRFEAVKRISGEPVPPPIAEDQRAVIRESKRP